MTTDFIDLKEIVDKNGQCDWRKAVGKTFQFSKNQISGKLTIQKLENKSLTVCYNNICSITCSCLKSLKLGCILGTHNKKYLYGVGDLVHTKTGVIKITSQTHKTNDKNKYKYKAYTYECLTCGWSRGFITEDNLKKSGCLSCGGTALIKGINDIPTTDPWMIKYFQGGIEEAQKYTRATPKKVNFVCPDCGLIKTKATSISNLYKTHSIGCSCGDGYSYPNKIMFNLLSVLKVSFINEFKPSWCYFTFNGKNSYGIYDFYFELNNKKYIIEMDGGFHFKERVGRSKLSLTDILYKDSVKDRLARDNNIEIIRIDCQNSDLNYIKTNIEKSMLSFIFDLTTIDWKSVGELALKNRVKLVCDTYRKDSSKTTTEIGKMLNMRVGLVRDYLKKGASVGWCTYTPQIGFVKKRSLLK